MTGAFFVASVPTVMRLIRAYGRWVSDPTPSGILFCGIFVILSPVASSHFRQIPVELLIGLSQGLCVARLMVTALFGTFDARIYRDAYNAQNKIIKQLAAKQAVTVKADRPSNN